MKDSCWYYASDAAREELGEAPLDLLADAETVKSNAVRKVFKSGRFFIKFDRRPGHSFRNEFHAAQLCGSCGIPAVEHLAWGRTSEGTYLITRAAEGFAEGARLFRTRQAPIVYDAFADFLGKLLASNVWHPDLHPGNILIDPASGECRLVDLHGIRRRIFWDRFHIYLMERCIIEVRDYLSDAELTALIARCGIPAPERFLARALAREAVYLRSNFPKRRHQILSGYFKYTSLEPSGRLVHADVPEEAFVSAEETVFPEAEQLFLFSFFVEQANVPCRRVLAFDPGRSTVWLEREIPCERRSAASAGELRERLKINGIETSEDDYGPGFLDDVTGVFRRNS